MHITVEGSRYRAHACIKGPQNWQMKADTFICGEEKAMQSGKKTFGEKNIFIKLKCFFLKVSQNLVCLWGKKNQF